MFVVIIAYWFLERLVSVGAPFEWCSILAGQGRDHGRTPHHTRDAMLVEVILRKFIGANQGRLK